MTNTYSDNLNAVNDTTVLESTNGQDKRKEVINVDSALWYFAIGSMMNPTCMNNRDFVSTESLPGELLDYKLHFFGGNGFAEAIEEKGSSLHGVLHRTTPKQMDDLDTIEIGYVRQNGRARLYDGKITTVTVYCRPKTSGVKNGPKILHGEDEPPLQPYIELMVEGAKYFGVDQAYINWLGTVHCQPRPLPHEFKAFTVADPSSIPTMTFDEDVKMYNGMNGLPLRATVNGKVKEYIIDDANDDESWNKVLYLYIKFGQIEELLISKAMYDPKYKCPDKLEDFTREHSKYIEHRSYFLAERLGTLHKWRVVGRIKQKYKD